MLHEVMHAMVVFAALLFTHGLASRHLLFSIFFSFYAQSLEFTCASFAEVYLLSSQY